MTHVNRQPSLEPDSDAPWDDAAMNEVDLPVVRGDEGQTNDTEAGEPAATLPHDQDATDEQESSSEQTHPGSQSTTRPRPTSIDALIRFVGVHKAFGRLKVLTGVDLDFEAGKTTVILGPSGTGKSVLLKHMVGLLRPDAGEVWFEDKRIDDMRDRDLVEVRKQFGFLFQMAALFDSMTVADNVCFPLVEHTKLSKPDRRDKAEQALKMVGLAGIGEKMPGELSGGQKKRVALARAVVLEPKVVLYDEPTTGLDPIRSDVINELILALNHNLGVTGVVVTHDIASARKVADRMVMLHGGKVIADGDADAFEQSDNERVRRFMNGEADVEDLDLIRGGFGH